MHKRYLPLGLKCKYILPALASVSGPRGYSIVAVILVKVLWRMTHGSSFWCDQRKGESP